MGNSHSDTYRAHYNAAMAARQSVPGAVRNPWQRGPRSTTPTVRRVKMHGPTHAEKSRERPIKGQPAPPGL